MECPKCQAHMEVVRFDDTDVDRCVRCGGLWFDRLEDEELSRRDGAEAVDSGPAWQGDAQRARKGALPSGWNSDGSDDVRGATADPGGVLPHVPWHIFRCR